MLASEQNIELAQPHPTPVAAPEAPAGLLRFMPSLYAVAAVAVLGAIFVVALLPRMETDFWWHLKVGQYIVQHHVVPSRDFMSFTFRGHPWTDHEWLAEITLYGTYRLAGLWGPTVLFALVICAAFSFVYATMVQQRTNKILSLFVLAAAFTASRGSWGPRIQMLSLLFLAIFAFVLTRYKITRDRRLLVALPIVMVVWANVHGGFVLGLVVVAITLAGEWLNYVTHHEDAMDPSDLRALAFALVATLAVTIINPNGVRQLLYPLTFILPNAYTNQIEESASPNFHMLVMMIFEGMLLLLIASALISRLRVNWTNLLLVVAFTHLAFSQVRNVPLWCVVVSPLLAYYLESSVPVLRREFPRFQYRRRPVRGRLAPILNGALQFLVVVVYALETHAYITPRAMRTAEQQNFPTGAIAYLERHPLPPRVFVSYAWGGYLLWHLSPRYSDFMDSRADTLFNSRILNAYLTAYGGAVGWESVLRRYRVEDVLIERDAPLAQLLAKTPSWRLVYHDSMSVMYTRA